MTRNQAVNYLRSSGFSEGQITAIADAFSNSIVIHFDDIREYVLHDKQCVKELRSAVHGGGHDV